jgi:hypothetical protein
MVDLSKSGNITVDGIVVRWVREDHVSELPFHDFAIGSFVSAVAAINAVAS